ncbi:MAG: hypothetical protein EXS36_17250 [Pedosphaera sp.]|nr:hypothetical protein [Pedosphaera sp.]
MSPAIVTSIFAVTSLGIYSWQVILALRFQWHQSEIGPVSWQNVTVLKPLKGADGYTAECLSSWMREALRTQEARPTPIPTSASSTPNSTLPSVAHRQVQLLFGVHSDDDPVVPLVNNLIAQFPGVDARLVVCSEKLGLNQKVSTLIQLARLARNPILVVSDSDVWIPSGHLSEIATRLADPKVGMANSFYRLANPVTAGMQWEAVATNADFWSQVLQSRSLKAQDFALGASMSIPQSWLDRIGGFESVADHLADDYQLGHRVANAGGRIDLCTSVVECRHTAYSWADVCAHQLRWARTIRVCQPVPFAASILGNVTVFAIVWALVAHSPTVTGLVVGIVYLRMITATFLRRRLGDPASVWKWCWLAPVKDLLTVLLWAAAFLGNTVTWRGNHFFVQPDGRLVRRDV